jgi:4-amino-4-deoxychorismate lyase
MSLFFETLKIENGKILNLEEHNIRLNRTINAIYKKKAEFNLSHFIKIPDEKTYRCKVIYGKNIQSIDFLPFNKRVFNSFKIIYSNIDYPYKSVNRAELDNLFMQKELCDDILIVKDGLITDTSIANIAIYDGFKWITPKKPLLRGTQRAKLLKDKLIIEKDIKVKDMKNTVRFAIMNALLGFQEIKDIKFKGISNDS